MVSLANYGFHVPWKLEASTEVAAVHAEGGQAWKVKNNLFEYDGYTVITTTELLPQAADKEVYLTKIMRALYERGDPFVLFSDSGDVDFVQGLHMELKIREHANTLFYHTEPHR